MVGALSRETGSVGPNADSGQPYLDLYPYITTTVQELLRFSMAPPILPVAIKHAIQLPEPITFNFFHV